jgi:purine-binding chemotaxis protein CheW
MSALFLIVRLAGQRIAFHAAQVESVVEIEAVTPVPGVAVHVAGLAAIRSRVVTVIDSATALSGGIRDESETREAVVVVADGHPYALIVDSVEDVVEVESDIHPSPDMLEIGWRRATCGVVQIEGELLLVADIAALISGPAAEAA